MNETIKTNNKIKIIKKIKFGLQMNIIIKREREKGDYPRYDFSTLIFINFSLVWSFIYKF